MNTISSKDNIQSILPESESSIPSTTRLGYAHLTVASLDDQITFYQNILGMQLQWREGASAGLGAGDEDLLRLTEVKGAQRTSDTTGLYHFALLYPSRKELARAIARLLAMGYPNNPTDHFVSETIYLDDPEGQNIELYIRTLNRGSVRVVTGKLVFYRSDGKTADGRGVPLDLDSLLGELPLDDQLLAPMPKGTKLGHLHLYATSLDDEMHFYHDVLGFQKGPVATRFRMADVGLSEDQPHVIAWNTWRGKNAPRPPENSLGLRYFTIELPNQRELESVLERIRQDGIAMEETKEGILVRDPASIGVVLTSSRKP